MQVLLSLRRMRLAVAHPLRAHLAVLVTLLVALPVFAYRREYTTTVEGKRKEGSEVCFYRGIKGDAFSLFFTPGNVACLSADEVLDFPPGLIHVFARHRDGYASVHRDYTVYEGPPNPEKGYEKLEIPMVRAGVIDFGSKPKKLQANQRLGVWIASTPTSSGTFLPLVPGESTILAPAEILVVPLLIEDGLPAGAGEPVYLAAGERKAAALQPAQDRSDVIVWTRVDRASLDEVRSTLAPPTITIRAGEQTYKPVAPLYADFNSLLIFRGIPRAKAVVTVEGRMWKPVRRDIRVLPQPVTIEREPIPLTAGGSVLLRWSKEEAVPIQPECAPVATSERPRLRAALLRCTNTPEGASNCSPVSRASTPYSATSSISFDGVPAGSYRVLIEPPYGKRQSLAAEVAGGRLTTVDVNLPAFNFFGSVKLNGKPIQARLVFVSGQVMTDRDGRYTATLAADPLDNQIKIERCEDARTFTFLPHESPQPNAVYDIDLRLATIDVKVIDADRSPVAGALVRFSPIKQIRQEGNEVYFGSAEKQTDGEGHTSFDDVPDGFQISVCAVHKQFGRKCSAPIDLKKLPDRGAVVQFDPAGMRGRVSGHSGEGTISIVSPAGVVTEDAQLDEDGSFLFHGRHAAPEYLIYVSRTHALTVLPLPMTPPADFVIELVPAPTRTFTVSAQDMKADFGFVGLWVGGRYIPLQVLNANQEMRGMDSILYRNKSLEIRDIAETGPITVALGFPEAAAREFVDVFTLPQYAGVARVSVTGPSVVLGAP